MRLILIFFTYITLFADAKEEMFNLYQNEKYEKSCNLGYSVFDNNAKDEEFISLYAFSCLKSDYIDRLAMPISLLKFTKESRSNAAYFSIILMQKKLLYHSLIDEYDLSKLKLPTTNHILSKIFDLYTNLGKHQKRSVYIFEDEHNPKVSYRLFVVHDNTLSKMVIEEYYDTISVQRHVYW